MLSLFGRVMAIVLRGPTPIRRELVDLGRHWRTAACAVPCFACTTLQRAACGIVLALQDDAALLY